MKIKKTKNIALLKSDFIRVGIILTGKETKDEILQIKSLANSRKFGDKSNVNNVLIKCPKCNRKSKLLWVPHNRENNLPKCEKCFYTYHNKDKKLYDIYFLPHILINDKKSFWTIHEGLSKNNYALKSYIEFCLNPDNCPAKIRPYLTIDKSVLLELCNQLKKNSSNYDKKDVVILKNLTMAKIDEYPIDILKVPWKILPKGENPFDDIKSLFINLQKKKNKVIYDLSRLEFIYSMEPTQLYIGQDEFEGYVVFNFSNINISILDCPMVGNAIYIMFGDWRSMSKSTKAELMSENYRIIRIVHRGDWKNRLLKILNKESYNF